MVCDNHDPAIELRGVSFAYDAQPVLEAVDLSIARHEAVCIVGPNGGGKTTLVKLVLGALQPQKGTVRVFGKPPAKARLQVGYMPQHLRFDPQFPMTAIDIVLMGRLGRPGLRGALGWYSAADRAAARAALATMDLADLAHWPFAKLSGGQRQRVLIARALCSEPELLLLDEPTANVDTLLESRLLGVLRELGARMTIVMVSHDLGFVSSLVERVVCVNRHVQTHSTSRLTADALESLYGAHLQMVHHHAHDHGPPRQD